VRVKFTDWWSSWKWQDYPLCSEILHKKLGMEIVDEDPDLILYGIFFDRGDRRSKFNGTIDAWNPKYNNIPKVCFSGESMTNEWINKILNHGDYLMYSKKVNHPKYLRVTEIETNPSYNIKKLLSAPVPQKTKFCSFVYNSRVPKRENFCKELMRYKKVDCLGKSLKNAESPILTKRYEGPCGSGIGQTNIEAIKPYKFNIGFENKIMPGYMTEKAWWGFLAKTITIYYGDPTIHDLFNKGSFLCRSDYNSDKKFIDAIIELDNDDNAYNEMINKYPIRDKTLIDDNYIINFFKNIV
jgi:hypothetical protein